MEKKDKTERVLAEFLDSVYLQQNGFDKVDAATDLKRQKYVFGKISEVLNKEFSFDQKEIARKTLYELRHLFIDWNYKEFQSQDFQSQEKVIDDFIGTQIYTD